MTVVTISPMDKTDDVDQAKIEDYLEISIKENEGESKGGRRLQKLLKCLDFVTDVTYEFCLLISLSVLTIINVCSNININPITGVVKMLGNELILIFGVQVFLFVVAWKCRRSCFWVSIGALMIMWLFSMQRTGVRPWNNNMGSGTVLGYLQSAGN